MKTVEVTVTYEFLNNQHIVSVEPFVAEVDEGHEIKFTFKRPNDIPGKMRVKFTDKQFFETNNPAFAKNGEVDETDGPVRVKTRPTPTTYDCQMLDQNGKVIAERKAGGGGHVEPVKTLG